MFGATTDDASAFSETVRDRRHQLELTHKIWSTAASPKSNSFVSIDKERILRSLTAFEIETLTTVCGCKCKNWSQVCLLMTISSNNGGGSRIPFSNDDNNQAFLMDQSQRLRELISNTNFEGVVVLAFSITTTGNAYDNNNLDPWRRGPMGIHSNFLISNSIISLQSWVSCNTVICDTHVFPSSVVIECGSLTASSSSSVGDKSFLRNDGELMLTVGPESGGGRHLTVTPESDMMHVCQQLTTATATTSNYRPAEVGTADPFVAYSNSMNVISSHCVVRNTPSIEGIYLAPHSSIQAATSVSNVILFPTATIQNACTVDNVRLQWKASISDASRVSDVLLMEESHIGPNSFVASSILGPDVHVSTGEVHCSVLGPNTNAHHQSLVISVLWPLGRGNVGYGANIGSNHTGRIPDQETTSGEGVFWGLSCVIKFPVDLTMAPYSIVAAGTSLPPQRVCMPFSLIVSSSDSSSSNNSILPGWVLSSSPYTIARSEKKYATRQKATRHKHYTGWKIIRPEIISMCRWARKQLQSVAPPQEGGSSTTYVTEKAVKGIGSNVLNEKGRLSGIKAYSECIQKFALEGLLSWMKEQDESGGGIDAGSLQREFSVAANSEMFVDAIGAGYEQVTWPEFPWATNATPLWSYQKALLLEEFPCKGDLSEWVSGLLEMLVVLEKIYAARIYNSKKRDDQRGSVTIPGYEACHVAGEMDPVITDAQRAAEEIESTARHLIGKMKRCYRSKL